MAGNAPHDDKIPVDKVPDAGGRARCEFRFYEELNDFLRPALRKRTFTHDFDGTPTVKDRVESLGVPHTEVDLILVDGQSVDFDRRLCGGERVAVYPVFERFDLHGVTRLRPHPLRSPRFLLDVHLGRLAAYLRLLGFDSRYRNDADDDELLDIATESGRILLTRDVGLLKRAALTRGAFLHETDPRRQLREVVDRFELWGTFASLTRCARCNGLITPTTRQDARGSVPEQVAREQRTFSRCGDCCRIYWRGSHVERLRRRLAEVGVTW
ncbi:Mut7-C RNAse domain-containing protein [Speluncibacter jeojiensis]|uniref:Mut7-C ubiquitin/RNAse domain-containing protein n=1 Tax=Speluncibacter jeojiensis TaxID=2710754 RepID=A0A9X4M3Q7_9ACTN|nr:Mut7-C ubiquitin/RNAse domain-containing protein [Corynebacteriales bacterium D3-21]